MKKRFVAVIICILVTLFLVASAKAAESLTIYVNDGNADYLAELIVTGENDIDTLMSLLVQNQMVPAGTKVNSFEITEEKNKRVGKLDLSKEYGTAVGQTGTAGETMYIYSVVNTVIKNLGLDEVYLTVDGNIISTGHAIYDWNLTFYDHIIAAADWSGNTVSTQSVNGDGIGQSSENSSTDNTMQSESHSDEAATGSMAANSQETVGNTSQSTEKSQEVLDSEGIEQSSQQITGDTEDSNQSVITEMDESESSNRLISEREDTSLSDTFDSLIQKVSTNKGVGVFVLLICGGAIACLFICTVFHVGKKKKL